MGEADAWCKQAGEHAANDVRKVIFKKHAARWASMDPKAKERYMARAAVERSASQRALEEQLEVEKEAASLAKRRLQDQLSERPPCCSQCAS